MKAFSLTIRTPVVLLFSGILLLLSLSTGLLYKEKKTFQEKNRELIIQNDSIMSVNILLTDSLRQKLPGYFLKKTLVSKSDFWK
jgi:hypothetical protein